MPGRFPWLNLLLPSPETMENRDKTKPGKLVFPKKELWCRDPYSGGGSSTGAGSLSLSLCPATVGQWCGCRGSLSTAAVAAAEGQPAAPGRWLRWLQQLRWQLYPGAQWQYSPDSGLAHTFLCALATDGAASVSACSVFPFEAMPLQQWCGWYGIDCPESSIP